MKYTLGILTLAAAVAAAGCQSTENQQYSQDGTNPQTTGRMAMVDNQKLNDSSGLHLSPDDRSFINDAGNAGAFEIKASELAKTKSNDAGVKDLAQHMIDDHKKAAESLAAIAKIKGIAAPTAPSVEQEQMIGSLNNLSGTDFDREYLGQQQAAHKAAIALFETESTNGRDRDLRDFATNTLPALRDHLRMVNSQLGTANGTNTNTYNYNSNNVNRTDGMNSGDANRPH